MLTIIEGPKTSEKPATEASLMYSLLQFFTTQTYRDDYINGLIAQVGRIEYDRVKEVIDAKNKLFPPSLPNSEIQAERTREQRLDQILETYSVKVRVAVNQILEIESREVFTPKAEAALKILKIILNKANNKSSEHHGTFENLDGKYSESGNSKHKIHLGVETEISIPISLFYDVMGFADWDGRAAGHMKKGESSADVISRYASMSQNTAPAVDDIGIYVYKDGTVKVQTGNSHRVASAIKRGDASVLFKGSAVVHLV